MNLPAQTPILDLVQDTKTFEKEYLQAINEVVFGAHYINGPQVGAFEKEVAQYLKTKHAIAVNSGTDALTIALLAAGIGKGDEVITSAFTFFATVESIEQVGATPVLCDANLNTFNINAEEIETKVTAKTKAIIPVHLFGQSSDMEAIFAVAKKHNLKVVEDNAQAFGGEYCGKKLGTLGAAGAHSFFPSKNLGCFGDGGLITTNDDELAKKALMLRQHGALKKYHNEVLGFNSRLDTIQAAVLLKKLPRLDSYNNERRKVAKRYNESLKTVSGIVLPEEKSDGLHVYHQYTIRVKNGKRDVLMNALAAKGIQTMVYYPMPIHELPYYRSKPKVSFPNAETLSREVLSLPIWPQMPEAVQDNVIKEIKGFLNF